MNRFALVLVFAVVSVANASGVTETRSATYTVPVPAELENLAYFENIEVKIKKRREGVKIEYQLPLELTGVPIEVEAVSKDEAGTYFEGPYARMSCDQDNCAITYRDLATSEEIVMDHLKSKGITGEELNGRMQVFQRFVGGDPGGILSFQN